MERASALFVLFLSAVAMATPAAGAYRLLQTIPVPGDGGWDHPTVDSAARRLYVTHGTHVVVSAEGKVVGAFDLGGKPELAGTDGQGNVFVNLVQKNVVLQIDAHKMTAGQTWPVAPCEGPRTMAVDHKNGRLFIGCANRRMVILDSSNGRAIGSLPIGPGPDDSAYDPETRLIYISNGDGTVSVIQQESPDKYSLLETVRTAPGARNMALDPKTKRIYLPLSDRGPPPPTAQAPST